MQSAGKHETGFASDWLSIYHIKNQEPKTDWLSPMLANSKRKNALYHIQFTSVATNGAQDTEPKKTHRCFGVLDERLYSKRRKKETFH